MWSAGGHWRRKRHVQSGLLPGIRVETERQLAVVLPEGPVVRLHAAHQLGIDRRIVRGHRVVRRALEDGELARLLRDDRDRLDGRGAGARVRFSTKDNVLFSGS